MAFRNIPRETHLENQKRTEKREYRVYVESVGFRPKVSGLAHVRASSGYGAGLVVLDWRPEDWDPEAWVCHRKGSIVPLPDVLEGKPFRVPEDWRIVTIEKI